ncbi:Negative growth regulatory protein NGR1 [Cyberlindnera fabianii]|uniref:Negative growth regulatory protein NGR1 n=1 Tax=Cyberlindnera fabianii TaxID=36022 RepID=A0A1V2L8T6_CYBFA|nr:Negative growth regulatory protein NGR1 [Cyberlindnera fabianii]
MSAQYNNGQGLEQSSTPAPGDAQQQASQQPPQSQQQQQQGSQQPQITQQPVAQLGGSEFLTPLPIPNPPSATASTSSSPPKTLWMGDLDPWSDEEAIENLWDSLGKRVLVKLIKAKRGTPAANLNTGHAGYCFVEFENYDEAKSALALNGSLIPNTTRQFRLNWASGATLSSPIPQSPEYSLFVGDLSPSTTEAHLLALFQTHFKSVKTVRVMTDPITGTSRCFGFVRFSDEEERRRALTEMSGVWCAGRPLRVALATPRSQANNMGGANVMGGQFPGQFPGAQFAQQQQQPDMMMYQYQQVPPSMQFYDQDGTGAGAPGPGPVVPPVNGGPGSIQSISYSDPNNTTVFVGGLAAGVTENMLATLFQPFGPIVHIKIPPNKGCGFIRFEKREDAVDAINAMQGFVIGGSRIRLSWGRQQNQQRLQMAMAAAMQGNGLPPAGVAPPQMGGAPAPGPQQLSPGMAPPPVGVPPQSAGMGGLPGTAPFAMQMVPPVNTMYMMPPGDQKFGGYDQFGQVDPQQYQPQQMEQYETGEKEESPETRGDAESGSKLEEMYKAAVAGKLDSLH